MGRNAYLIVTDLHFSYKNLRNRYDYRAEVLDACKFIINLAADYKRKGYTITLLLLGDVFHRSYSDVFNACTDNNFFYMWANTFGEIYSVIGNHELSYYSSNPFIHWFLTLSLIRYRVFLTEFGSQLDQLV